MQVSIDDLIAENAGLVFLQLKKFKLVMDPEAESIGYEALHRAILTYDKSKNVRFSTYASVCIYNALGSYVRTLNKQRQLEVMSYNNVAYSDDGTEHEFVDFMASPDTTEDNVLKAELCGVVHSLYRELYTELSNDTHRAILDCWRENEYDISMVAIAKAVGVSQPYVSHVIRGFKNRFKKRMEEQY